jgi:hypothetical protein
METCRKIQTPNINYETNEIQLGSEINKQTFGDNDGRILIIHTFERISTLSLTAL